MKSQWLQVRKIPDWEEGQAEFSNLGSFRIANSPTHTTQPVTWCYSIGQWSLRYLMRKSHRILRWNGQASNADGQPLDAKAITIKGQKITVKLYNKDTAESPREAKQFNKFPQDQVVKPNDYTQKDGTDTDITTLLIQLQQWPRNRTKL